MECTLSRTTHQPVYRASADTGHPASSFPSFLRLLFLLFLLRGLATYRTLNLSLSLSFSLTYTSSWLHTYYLKQRSLVGQFCLSPTRAVVPARRSEEIPEVLEVVILDLCCVFGNFRHHGLDEIAQHIAAHLINIPATP